MEVENVLEYIWQNQQLTTNKLGRHMGIFVIFWWTLNSITKSAKNSDNSCLATNQGKSTGESIWYLGETVFGKSSCWAA